MAFLKNDVGLNLIMVLKKTLLVLVVLLTTMVGFAQTDTTRRAAKTPVQEPARREFKAQRAVLFRFNYTPCFATNDLAKRFGTFSSLGGSVGYKFENGLDIRAEGSFLFGRNIKEYSVLDSLRNSDGYVIDQKGNNYNPSISMRGYTFSAHIGKLFPVSRNRNSGIFVSFGGGFIQHKLHFQNLSVSPQLSGDYLKGYDRLTNGYMLNEYIGYQFMSIKKMINFYVGLEFVQGTTTYARNWNYDLMGPDNRSRKDNYWGIRFGWILPIYTANKGEDEFIFR